MSTRLFCLLSSRSIIPIFVALGLFNSLVQAQEKKATNPRPAPAQLDREALKKVGSIVGSQPNSALGKYVLDYRTPVDVELQKTLEVFDYELRLTHDIETNLTAAGVIDLKTLRFAAINPDKGQYASSVPKAAVILTYFQTHPEAATNLDAKTRFELGQIAKESNYEVAAIYSNELGLRTMQDVFDAYGLYDRNQWGGLWVGKHYGSGHERYPDPIYGHSHTATVRQLLRYFLLMEQGKLVSPEASKTMREIFLSPDLKHKDEKFVKALAGRELQFMRKAGGWQTYKLDSALITGSNRQYILVAMVTHANGDKYIEDMAIRVDDLMKASAPLR